MSAADLHLIVPGPLDQRTGGYIYDARMVEGLREAGRTVRVHELDGEFPDPDATARASLREALAGIPDDAVVLLDGLAMGGLPEVVEGEADRLRTISLVHHPLADETGIGEELQERFRATEREGLSAVRGAIVTSTFTAGRLEDFGVPPERIRVVVPGTERSDAGGPSASGGPASGGPTPGRDRIGLLCVATLTPRKGQDLLIEALAGLAELPWRLTLVGSDTRDPEFVRSLREATREAGLEERVELLGELGGTALEEEWGRADLFVLPSHHEGYGMALTEALVRGLPIVSTTGGAIPHTVPSEASVLVEPGDAAALREALARVLGDGRLRSELASSARVHGERLPDWSQQSARFARAIEELAG